MTSSKGEGAGRTGRERVLTLKGVIPAIILPLKPDYSIDEDGLRRHVGRVLAVPGVTGIVCNAHASEVTLLTAAERRAVLSIVREETRGRVPVIAGVYAESTAGAVDSARDAKSGGADALLIMPAFSFYWGVSLYPEVVLDYFSAIDREVAIPFVVFQYAHWTNCSYDSETLVRLTGLQNLAAVKSAINDPGRYEREYRALKAARPEVAVLNANDVQLLSYFAIGSDGAIVGYASLAPELIIRLFNAVSRGDLREAMRINDFMYPLTQAIYSHPRLNWHTRIKEALVMMGELDCAAARPFLPPLDDGERTRIRHALVQTGLLR